MPEPAGDARPASLADLLDPLADPPLLLDLGGLRCPLPALRTRKALRALAPGARLLVIATDPLAGLDIPNVAREEGASVEAQAREGAVLRFVIRARRGVGREAGPDDAEADA